MLVRNIKPGESLLIGDAEVRVIKKSGRGVQLSISAPETTTITHTTLDAGATKRMRNNTGELHNGDDHGTQ